MKIKFTCILIITIVISLFSFVTFANDLQTVVKGNNDFGFDLYQELKDEEGNLFFSPYSISTVLTMTYAGARGETEKEMAEVLHFYLGQEQLHLKLSKIQLKLNSIQERGYIQLSIANSLWFQEGYHFLDEFVSLNKNYYDSELKFVDFIDHTEEARIAINTWVEKETKDKIKDIIKPGVLTNLTKLVLCNAIYLKAPWAYQFDKNDTKKASFHLTSQENIQADMMNQIEDFRYKDFGSFSALELPYASDQYLRHKDPSMIIFLPKEIEGLTQFEENFTYANVKQWINELKTTYPTEVIISIPKFKITSEFDLANTLSTMGMPNAFNLRTADFSGMTGTKEFFIGGVIHKAFVDVNEKGTEAAAATFVAMDMCIDMEPDKPKPQKFIADHPFIFLVRDNQTGSILFIGRIIDPTK